MKRIILASIATLALGGYALAENAVPPQDAPRAAASAPSRDGATSQVPFLSQLDRTTTSAISKNENNNSMYETPRSNLNR
jgi:hypothetical protein